MVVYVCCSSLSAAVLLHSDTRALTPYTAKHLLCLDIAASLQMFYNRIIHLGMFLFEHDDIKIWSL